MATSPYILKEMGVQALVDGIKKLWKDDASKDLTIISGEEKIMVHKAILCSRSDFFKAACTKGTFKKGRESVIDLSADDEDTPPKHPSPVRLMIEYLYTLDYDVKTIQDDDTLEQPTKEDRSLSMHARMFILADKYSITDLKALSHEKFYLLLETYPGVTGLDLIDAIQLVYGSHAICGDPKLQRTIKEHLKWRPFLYQSMGVREAMMSAGNLMFDLFFEMRSERPHFQQKIAD